MRHSSSLLFHFPPAHDRCRGLSLYELIIAVAVVSALSVGTASLHGFVARQRIAAHTNQLLGDLHLARSEAIKRNAPVTVCKSRTGLDCTPESSWREGWIVFVDADLNYSVAAAEPVIRVQQAIANATVDFRGSSPHHLHYNSMGVSDNGTFTLCDTTDNSHPRFVALYRGKARVSDSEIRDGTLLTCP